MKQLVWFILVGVLLLILITCGPGDEAEPKVVTGEIGGVTYVHNPAEPV